MKTYNIFLCVLLMLELRWVYGKKEKDKCCKEQDAMKIAKERIALFQKQFNLNEINKVADIYTDDVLLMFNGAATLHGKEAGRENLQNLRDNHFDKVKITILEAVQLSCTRMYVVDTFDGFNNGQIVASGGRALIVWEKIGDEWFIDIEMVNDGEEPGQS